MKKNKLSSRYSLLSAIIICLLSIYFTNVNATLIDVSGYFAEPNFGIPNGTLIENGDIFDVNDGDLGTGLTVAALPGEIDQSQGVNIRWDFDISDYSSISSFTGL